MYFWLFLTIFWESMKTWGGEASESRGIKHQPRHRALVLVRVQLDPLLSWGYDDVISTNWFHMRIDAMMANINVTMHMHTLWPCICIHCDHAYAYIVTMHMHTLWPCICIHCDHAYLHALSIVAVPLLACIMNNDLSQLKNSDDTDVIWSAAAVSKVTCRQIADNLFISATDPSFYNYGIRWCIVYIWIDALASGSRALTSWSFVCVLWSEGQWCMFSTYYQEKPQTSQKRSKYLL